MSVSRPNSAIADTDNASQAFSIVCLSPQDWGASLPTNRQQIMRRAADRGHPVLFVETGHFLGTHALQLIRGPGRRSLVRRLTTGEKVAPLVTVRKTLNLLPWGQRYRTSSVLNGRFNSWVVSRAARQLPRPRIVWLYDPTATWAIGGGLDGFAVYDCVDDYTEQTSGERNRRLIAEADDRAARMSRIVFTTSKPLYERHSQVNPRTHLVPNVGDFDHFAPGVDRAFARPDLARLPRPVLGFAGNFLPGKVDFDLIDALAAWPSLTGSLVLAGPATAPEAAERLTAVASRPNVTWLGGVEYQSLPAVVASFDVALIPYLENKYTRSCFPLKLFEYLAAGKPVVASGLPELRGMEPDVTVTSGATAFLAAVSEALEIAKPEEAERRQAIAAMNTWDARTARLLELITEELG